MLLLVAWLFYETQSAVSREMRLCGRVQNNYRKEMRVYAIVSIFFGLSYVVRYAVNVYVYAEASGYYLPVMLFMMAYILEGLSMGVVMILHFVNFKKEEKLVFKVLDETKDSLVQSEDLHFFSNKEIASHDLGDESSIEKLEYE